MTMMRHNGYEAAVEYDDDAGLFHGEVVNIRDAITFQGRSVDEFRRAFAESVEDYVAFCQARAKKPNSPCPASSPSGSTLRPIGPFFPPRNAPASPRTSGYREP